MANSLGSVLEISGSSYASSSQEYDIKKVLEEALKEYTHPEKVTEIDLSDKELKGVLPCDLFHKFTNLKTLDIGHNDIHWFSEAFPVKKIVITGNQWLETNLTNNLNEWPEEIIKDLEVIAFGLELRSFPDNMHPSQVKSDHRDSLEDYATPGFQTLLPPTDAPVNLSSSRPKNRTVMTSRLGSVLKTNGGSYASSSQEYDTNEALEEALKEYTYPEKVTEIDLSNKGLQNVLHCSLFLPFKNLRKLYLNGNDLTWLSEELKDLPLKELNITGNRRLVVNLQDWLGEIEGLKLLAIDLELKWLPRGMHSSQVECLDKEDLENYEKPGFQTLLPPTEAPVDLSSSRPKKRQKTRK